MQSNEEAAVYRNHVTKIKQKKKADEERKAKADKNSSAKHLGQSQVARGQGTATHVQSTGYQSFYASYAAAKKGADDRPNPSQLFRDSPGFHDHGQGHHDDRSCSDRSEEDTWGGFGGRGRGGKPKPGRGRGGFEFQAQLDREEMELIRQEEEALKAQIKAQNAFKPLSQAGPAALCDLCMRPLSQLARDIGQTICHSCVKLAGRPFQTPPPKV